MMFHTQIKPPDYRPKDSHIIKWPGDNRAWWYDSLYGQYVPGSASMFDGGDAWELHEDDEDDFDDRNRPLPWRI